jgi:hypothetical protein
MDSGELESWLWTSRLSIRLLAAMDDDTLDFVMRLQDEDIIGHWQHQPSR